MTTPGFILNRILWKNKCQIETEIIIYRYVKIRFRYSSQKKTDNKWQHDRVKAGDNKIIIKLKQVLIFLVLKKVPEEKKTQ